MNSRKAKIILYGDRYQSSTRAIEALCKLSSIAYSFQSVSVFRKENLSRDFTAVNPNQTVPCLKQGDILILSLDDIFNFLSRRGTKAAYVSRHTSNLDAIEKINDWYQRRFIRHALAIQMLGGINFHSFATDKLQAIIHKFSRDLAWLEKSLSELQTEYLCGAQICPTDLLIYCEIYSAIIILPKDSLKLATYPSLQNWYNLISSKETCWSEIRIEFRRCLDERQAANTYFEIIQPNISDLISDDSSSSSDF